MRSVNDSAGPRHHAPTSFSCLNLLILPQSSSLWHHTYCSQVEPLKLGCLAASLQNSLNINPSFYSRVKYLISCPALPVPSFRSPWSLTVVCKMYLTVFKSSLKGFLSDFCSSCWSLFTRCLSESLHPAFSPCLPNLHPPPPPPSSVLCGPLTDTGCQIMPVNPLLCRSARVSRHERPVQLQKLRRVPVWTQIHPGGGQPSLHPLLRPPVRQHLPGM